MYLSRREGFEGNRRFPCAIETNRLLYALCYSLTARMLSSVVFMSWLFFTQSYRVLLSPLLPGIPLMSNSFYFHRSILLPSTKNNQECNVYDFVPDVPINLTNLCLMSIGQKIPGKIRKFTCTTPTNNQEWASMLRKLESQQQYVTIRTNQETQCTEYPCVNTWNLWYQLYCHNCWHFTDFINEQHV